MRHVMQTMVRCRWLFSVVFASVVTFWGIAGVTEVRVHVDGMACPFCAYNIEKRLKTLDGVSADAEFDVSVERGVAALSWKESVRFDPVVVREQVRRAGFTPGAIFVRARGSVRVVNDGEQLRVEDQESGEVINVFAGDRAERRQAFALLRDKATSSKTTKAHRAVISGAVVEDNAGWSVTLHHWAPRSFGASVMLEVRELTSEGRATNVIGSLVSLDGVLHADADLEQGQVQIWTTSESPDISRFVKVISDAGFSVLHVHTSVDSKKG